MRVGSSLSPRLSSSERKILEPKSEYSLNECFTLILKGLLGSGATGILHHATMEVSAGGNAPSSHDIVVKLAFSDEQRDRMHHEYRVYTHMVTAGVHGCIPDVYGLFEDVEGGALALLMSREGQTLWKHSPGEPGSEEVNVSNAVR